MTTLEDDGGMKVSRKSVIILSLFCRAQDQASMQLSEMEEEMDQRIHAAERKTREQVGQTHQHITCRKFKHTHEHGFVVLI